MSDPVRAALFNELVQETECLNCTDAMSRAKLKMPKSTCSQHYQILRESGLIWSERRGVELASRPRTDELETRFPGLIKSILYAYEAEAETTSSVRN